MAVSIFILGRYLEIFMINHGVHRDILRTQRNTQHITDNSYVIISLPN